MIHTYIYPYLHRSAGLRDTVSKTNVGDSPHGATSRSILSIDMRVECHVDVLVQHVDNGRSTRAGGSFSTTNKCWV